MKPTAQVAMILFLAGTCIPTFGQSINITGTVVDSANSQAIAGATVKLLEFPQFTATTASNGTFTLQGTPTGLISNMSIGYSMQTVQLRAQTLSIKGAPCFAPVIVDVYQANGMKVNHFSGNVHANGSLELPRLRQAQGMHLVKVMITGSTYVLADIGNSIAEKTAVQSSSKDITGLSKITADNTLEITAANYQTKRITFSGTTGNAGTIKLYHLTVQTGVWMDVTPTGILNEDFGVMDILADPLRPGEVYAFTCNRGVWKSTSAGANWTKITAPGVMEVGRAWGNAIELNPKRNPAVPPTLWACQGYGIPGLWRSTDGGVNWANFQTFPTGPGTNPYSLEADPYDSKHIITGLHHVNGAAESFDGGETWHDVTGTMSGGSSWYTFFIDTGDSATTRKTWIAISEVSNGSAGTIRTTDGGAHWTKVSSNEHPHGGAQIYQANGVVFMAGVYASEGWGVLRSTNQGLTWTHVGAGWSDSNVFGTPNHVYATCMGANLGGNPVQFQVGNAAGTSWTSPGSPSAMTNGPKRAAVTFDPSIGKYVLVGGCWNAGVWRYIEP